MLRDDGGVREPVFPLPRLADQVSAPGETLQEVARRDLPKVPGDLCMHFEIPIGGGKLFLILKVSTFVHQYTCALQKCVLYNLSGNLDAFVLVFQDEPPNDRKIGKLCEYISRNSLRVPKVYTVFNVI